MTTPTPTRTRALDPLAQDLAAAMVEILRRYAAEGRLPEELQRRAPSAAAPAEPQPRPDSALVPRPTERSKLTDRFQLLGPTGGDAFGESFLGRDTSTGNNVIIRLLHKQLGLDPAFMHSFGTSCDAMISLPRHAHVLETLAHGVHHGQPYVISESVRGRSLGDVISTGEQLPEMDVLRMAEQVAAALLHVKAHTGLHHGDLKPSSILVAYSGIAGIKAATEVESVRVADFVGPRLPWHDAARVPPLSSPHYVAPEQFSPDSGVDARTDMYALGAIMFHLLTGKPPYAGTPEEVRAGHLGLRIADPGELVSGLSDCTRQVVTTCLATSRNDRFINFQGFTAACTKALQTLNGLRSMRFLRKPMRRVPTPRPGELGQGTAAIARNTRTPAPKPATSTIEKGTSRIAASPPRASFPTPLPQEMPIIDEFEGRDRMSVVSERILRKHRERKGDVVEDPPATTTALIRRGSPEAAKEAEKAKEGGTAGSRRPIGSTGRKPVAPDVIPAPSSWTVEMWFYRALIALAVLGAVLYASGWRPL